jgi:hypothetical protein
MMLPRLRAEESMLMAERLAVGTGHARADKRRKIVRRWQRDLEGPLVRRRAPRPDVKTLQQMGIGVRVTRG